MTPRLLLAGLLLAWSVAGGQAQTVGRSAGEGGGPGVLALLPGDAVSTHTITPRHAPAAIHAMTYIATAGHPAAVRPAGRASRLGILHRLCAPGRRRRRGR